MTRTRFARLASRGLVAAMLAATLAAMTASCAYYNTFYLARKYYLKATDGQPYEVDRENTTQRSNYTKSGEYSKKLLGIYPKSKWVDDAWLMWARTLIGTDDPLKAVTMLEEFQERFPTSELRPDAAFFLGLSYRAARKHEQAVAAFDEFLVQAPKDALVPYAWYERSKALMSLQRYREASESAGQVLEKFRGHILADRALRQRAEARYQQHDWPGAQADFHVLGLRALTDAERLKFLLREVDCLESSRDYDRARATLRDARSHTPQPPPIPVAPRVSSTPGAGGALPVTPPPVSVVRTPLEEVYGRLTLRMGGVELLAGRLDPAVELYRSVLADYPRSQLSAEAQYRIAFAYETGSNDFAKARAEYAKVREQAGGSPFAQQADQRLENLDRIERFRTAAGADSMARKAEARFLTAELYLFSQDKPERAVQEYQSIADSSTLPGVRARALNAKAWVLARKLDRKASADSLFWRVVREYPSTEAQLAARDFLEAEGQLVPENLIVAPKEIAKPVLDLTDDALTPPPGGTPGLGRKPEASIIEPGAVRYGPGVAAPSAPAPLGNPSQWRYSHLPDSLRRAMVARDSLLGMARRDTSAAGRARVDSLRRVLARPDTVGRGALIAEIQRQVVRPDGVVIGPDDASPPDFANVDSLSRTALAGAASGALPGATPTKLPVAPRVKPFMRRVTSADSLRFSLVADSLRQRAYADSIRIRAASDSVRAVFEAPRRKLAADSLAQVTAALRVQMHTDSLARAKSDADSLARAAKKKPKKIKPPVDPNLGFSSLWTKSTPDSAKLAKRAAKQARQDAELEAKQRAQQKPAQQKPKDK